MDAMLHKELVLKARLKPYLDETYTVTGSIEGILATLEATQQKLQASNAGLVTEQTVEDTKQVDGQCTTEFVVIQVELKGIRKNISTPNK